MTNNNDLITALTKRIQNLKTGNQIHIAVAIELSRWLEAFKAEQQKQYEKGKQDGALLRQNVSNYVDQTIADIRKEAYQKGEQDERNRIKQAVEDSVNGVDGIKCDWTEDAYNRVLQIIEGKTDNAGRASK